MDVNGRKKLGLLCLLFLPALAYGDAFMAAASAMCEKSKSCAKASLAGEDLPPDMEAMMMQHIDRLCDSMQGQFAGVAANGSHPLYQPATACMESLAVQSCAELEGGSTTPACERYETMAERYD